MSQKFTFYPLGNAETCLLELSTGDKLLFDYAAMHDGTTTDNRIDIKKELSDIKEFKVVLFSHAHEDHTKGASDFFTLITLKNIKRKKDLKSMNFGFHQRFFWRQILKTNQMQK